MAGGRRAAQVPYIVSADLWDYPHLFEYWDERVGAIGRSAEALRQVNAANRPALLERIARLVRAKAARAPTKYLAQTGFVMTDDLYKAATTALVWDSVVHGYLSATAATFNSVLAERGLTISYVIDNFFPPDDLGRPLKLFGPWFGAAGFVYACPQEIAVELSVRTGERIDERLTSEAREVAKQVVDRCRRERRHLVYLDADFEVEAYGFLVDDAAKVPGSISIFRSQAPIAGTSANVAFPPGL